MDTPGQLGFFDLTHRYDALTRKGDPLDQLAQHIPWPRFRKTLEKYLSRSKRPKVGRPPFDAILMFKILVLQALYNLSDDQTEYQIRDRISASATRNGRSLLPVTPCPKTTMTF